MGIGPSTKETSLHHFRDPLLEVVAEDTDLDLLGLIRSEEHTSELQSR